MKKITEIRLTAAEMKIFKIKVDENGMKEGSNTKIREMFELQHLVELKWYTIN